MSSPTSYRSSVSSIPQPWKKGSPSISVNPNMLISISIRYIPFAGFALWIYPKSAIREQVLDVRFRLFSHGPLLTQMLFTIDRHLWGFPHLESDKYKSFLNLLFLNHWPSLLNNFFTVKFNLSVAAFQIYANLHFLNIMINITAAIRIFIMITPIFAILSCRLFIWLSIRLICSE